MKKVIVLLVLACAGQAFARMPLEGSVVAGSDTVIIKAGLEIKERVSLGVACQGLLDGHVKGLGSRWDRSLLGIYGEAPIVTTASYPGNMPIPIDGKLFAAGSLLYDIDGKEKNAIWSVGVGLDVDIKPLKNTYLRTQYVYTDAMSIDQNLFLIGCKISW